MFKAMIGPSPVVTMNAQGRRKTGRRMVDGTMIDNLAVRIRCIAVKGSDQNVLRLLELMHRVFPQPPASKNGKGHGPGLMTTHFIPPDQPAPAAAAEEPPAGPGSGIVMADGKEYVE
jgi:hypothetical protein